MNHRDLIAIACSVLLLAGLPAAAEPLPKLVSTFDNSAGYTIVDGELYFSGQKDLPELQIGVWKSDGTEAGTTQVSENILSYNFILSIYARKLGGDLVFVADQDSDGSNELYRLDEFIKASTRIEKFADVLFLRTIWILAGSEDRLYLEGLTSTEGRELWKTGGDVGAAELVKDICPGNCSAGIVEAVEFDGRLFFDADDGVHGSELWVSDGTETGTLLFSNLYSDSGDPSPGDYTTGSGPIYFNVLGDKLIFSANDGIHGRELWVTDGTPGNTHLLKDCTPGSKGGDPYDSNPDAFVEHNGRLYFTVFNETGERSLWELWQTDGTEAGTARLWQYDWPAGDFLDGGSVSPLELAAMQDKLFFKAQHPDYGEELFYYDLLAPERRPQLLKDVYSGVTELDVPNSSKPIAARVVDGRSVGKEPRLYFYADSAEYGYELWVSDGTPDGTVLLKDSTPGEAGSNLDEFEVVGSKLFFREDSRNLWLIDLADTGGEPDGVDLERPKIAFKKPAARAALGRRTVVRGTAADNKGIAMVECRYPGLSAWSTAKTGVIKTLKNGSLQTAWKCRVNISSKIRKRLLKKGGKLQVRVRAFDPAGNSGQGKRPFLLR